MSQNPLSIGSAVVGLVVAAGQITLGLNQFINSVKDAPKSVTAVVAEIIDITAALGQLQAYLIGVGRTEPARRPLLSLENIVVTVTGCVTTYSELEAITKKCSTGQPMGLFNRLEWMLRESDIDNIIRKLQNHKSSLTLMLTILQCETMREAETAMERLCGLVESLLQTNAQLQTRLLSIETIQVIGPSMDLTQKIPDDLLSNSSESSYDSTLIEELQNSRVYKRTLDRDSVFSVTSSKRGSLALSAFSDLSLGNVSVVSVCCLPLWQADLTNSEHYLFGSAQAELPSSLVVKLASEEVEPNFFSPGEPIPSSTRPDDDGRLAGISQSYLPDAHSLPPQDHETQSSDLQTIFLGASLFEFHIDNNRKEGGYIYLTYQAGEVFDILGTKGELWLARNQDDSTRTIGWVWEKHFARLLPDELPEDHPGDRLKDTQSEAARKDASKPDDVVNEQNMNKWEQEIRLALQQEALRFKPVATPRKIYTIPFLRRRRLKPDKDAGTTTANKQAREPDSQLKYPR